MRNFGNIRTLAIGLLALGACNNDDAAGAVGATQTDTDDATEGDDTDGDTDTDTDTDGEPVDPNPASPSVRELLQAACDLGLRCCSRGEVDYFLGPWVDASSCTDRLFDLATVSNAAALDLASLAGLTDVSLVVPSANHQWG